MRVCCGGRGSTANVCQFISSRSAARKPPSSGTAHTWGDYIFYLSLLASIFPANSRLGCNQPRKKPSLCVCMSTTVIPLCEHADRAPSLSGITTQILFPPYRSISQYLGIYRPLILAGQRLACIPCGLSQSPHEPPAFSSGGRGTTHAETQVFRLHYNSN